MRIVFKIELISQIFCRRTIIRSLAYNMGCCFGKNEASGDEERSPLIVDASPQSNYQTQGQVYDTVIIEVPPTNECPTVENTSSSFKFIPIDQNTNQAKDHKDRSAFYREKFGSYLRDAKVPQVLPNVIDPTTVLLLPCTGKEELDQVNQNSRTIANLIEQMRPKSKEPITAVTLD